MMQLVIHKTKKPKKIGLYCVYHSHWKNETGKLFSHLNIASLDRFYNVKEWEKRLEHVENFIDTELII